jgi:glycosyltransferase involved in cell wall biosynthesis
MYQDKIKILILIDHLYGLGGSERNLLQIITHIDRRKFSFIICPLDSDDNHIIKELKLKGVKVFPLQVARIYGLSGLRQAFRLRRILKENEIDIIQTIHFASDVYGTLIAKWSGVPVIISSRRDMGYKFVGLMHHNPGWHLLLMRRVLNKHVQKFISVSEKVRQTISESENIPLDKIVTIYNSIDITNFPDRCDRNNLAKQIGLDPQAPIIGTIANLRPIKGLEYFIHAAGTVIKSSPSCQFIVVGYEGSNGEPEIEHYYKKLLQLCRDLGLTTNFYFLGYAENSAPLVSMMDIFVLPSLSEGFSNSLLEAMAAKKAVIATDVGGNREALGNNESGILVPPKDAESLAQAITKLLKNENFRYELGKKARERIVRLFTIERMIQTFEDLYETVVMNTEDTLQTS